MMYLFLVLFISGCVSEEKMIENLAKQSELANTFLKEHPNAEIIVVKLSEEDVSKIIDVIRDKCGSQMQIKPYWKVEITDPDTQSSITSWIDVDAQELLCAYRISTAPQTTTVPSTTLTATTMILNQTCEDSDGGKNYYVRGIANPCPCHGELCPECGMWVDKCLNESTLLEYSCDNLDGEQYTCPYGCEDGTCLSVSPTT